MAHELSHEGEAARRAVIEEIYRAFEDVTRENGVSWNETDVLDGYGSPEECSAARASDTDTSWTQLVDDPNWRPFPGTGGFSFIDGTGFRYYLPPTMVRFARGDVSEWFNGHLLGVIERFVPNGPRMYSDAQLRAIARFVRFMAMFDVSGYRQPEETEWAEALRDRWSRSVDLDVPPPKRTSPPAPRRRVSH